jgi:hypothetical protein
MKFLPKSLIPVVAAGALLFTASSAQAASGITPLSPKANATVAAGKSPTFKMRVKGAGQVWVHVCKSKKKDSKGVICSDESIGQAKKKGGSFSYKPKFFDFDDFWLNSPGTYYWQAFRIQCEGGDLDDCLQESKIIKFKVG